MSKKSTQEIQAIHPSDEATETKKRRKRRRHSRSRILKFISRVRRRFSFGIALIFLITIVVSVVMVISAGIEDAASRLDASWQRLDRVINNIEDRQGADITLEDFDRLYQGVNDLRRNIVATQSQLRLVSPFVDYNDEWKISTQLLSVASQLTTSTGYMLYGIEPVVDFWGQDESNQSTSQISSGERIADLLEANQVSFRNAAGYLAQAENQLAAIDLSEASVDLVLSYHQIESFYEQLVSINSVLLESPNIMSQLMGLDEEVTYIILALNNDAIRPSGGKVEAYGWFNVWNGRITNYEFSPSTLTNPSPPSQSFVDKISIPNWWVAYETPLYAAWGGSWYADFTLTGQMALNYYNSGANPNTPVAGVIAVDLKTLENLVGLLGNVRLPGQEETLQLSNFRDMVYDPANFSASSYEDYFATIYSTVFKDLHNLKQNQASDLFTILIEALSQHHAMMYVVDPDTQSYIDLLDWSGKQTSLDMNDYLMIADTNLTNKADHSIVRSLTYNVEILPDQSRQSDLSVRYDYFSTLASGDPAIEPEYFGDLNYQTLTQVYLPQDVIITAETNTVSSSTTTLADYTVFITQADVAYDSSEQFQIVYETPPTENKVNNLYRYRLLIEKQPGIQIQELELQVKLPANANLVWLSQEPETSYVLEQPIIDYRLQIISDQWIEILYTLD